LTKRNSTTRGFKQTGHLLGDQIRRAGESRGFAVSRVVTHWAEVAGSDIARIAQPVKISYGRGGLGATLTVLTTGAQAPMLEMQKEKLRERVNAAYGYNAISRIHITQTSPSGFSEGRAEFGMPRPGPQQEPDREILSAVHETVTPIENDELRAALERLGHNVIVRSKRQKENQ
jgi:hypothetical protein